MSLTDPQLNEFHEKGFLFFPGRLAAARTLALQQALETVLERRGPEVIRE